MRNASRLLIGLFAALIGAPSAHAFVADPMDSLVGYSSESDSTTVAHAVLVEGDVDQAVQLKFGFNGGTGFAQLSKDFSLYNMGELYMPNSKFRFRYRATGPSNRLKLLLTDNDGDQAFVLFENSTSSPSWNRVELPRSSFTVVLPPPSGGNGLFDFFRVKKISLPIERSNAGGTGTLDIDKIDIFRPSAVSSFQPLDNFNSGPGNPFSANAFGGSIGVSPATGAHFTAYYDSSTANVFEGAYSFRITWDFNATTHTELIYFNSPNGADLSNFRQIEFYAKSSVPNETFTLAFGSSAVQQQVKVGGVTTHWQKIVVPFLTYDEVFRDGAGANRVTELVFRIVKNLSSSAGTLWIDDVRFVRPEFPGGVVRTVDDMEEPTSPALTSWIAFYDGQGSFAALESITDGVDRRALRLNYSLANIASPVSFVGLERTMEPNAALTDGVRFRYRYSGNANTLQFNALDANGARFFSETQRITSTGGQWRTLSLPFANFRGESATSSLDLKKLRSFRFTVVFDANGQGGEGLLGIDQFEILNVPRNAVSENEHKLIQRFAVDNNPFSPNGDGVRDTATFTYTLAEDSFVRLRVYDTNGSVVREIRKNAPDPAGEGALVWDAGSDEGVRVPNGLYFYRFDAESTQSDRKDKVRHVIGVLR